MTLRETETEIRLRRTIFLAYVGFGLLTFVGFARLNVWTFFVLDMLIGAVQGTIVVISTRNLRHFRTARDLHARIDEGPIEP